MTDGVRASQAQWRRARGFLNARRHDMATAAQDRYPSSWRVAGTPLLARPEWIPAEPVPLDRVRLSWRPSPSAREPGGPVPGGPVPGGPVPGGPVPGGPVPGGPVPGGPVPGGPVPGGPVPGGPVPGGPVPGGPVPGGPVPGGPVPGGPVLDGTEPETAAVRPLRDDGSRFGCYAEALGALAGPACSRTAPATGCSR